MYFIDGCSLIYNTRVLYNVSTTSSPYFEFGDIHSIFCLVMINELSWKLEEYHPYIPVLSLGNITFSERISKRRRYPFYACAHSGSTGRFRL